jgi:hypothetical protein
VPAFGSPTKSRREARLPPLARLFDTSALSELKIALNGVPVEKVVMPENCHPPNILLDSPRLLKRVRAPLDQSATIGCLRSWWMPGRQIIEHKIGTSFS